MKFSKTLLASLACGAILAAPLASAQGFPRMPKLPSAPKVPEIKLPGQNTGSPASQPERQPARQPARQPDRGGNDMNAYMQDVSKLATTIDPNWDGERVDGEVAQIKAAADRIAAGGYNGLPPQMVQSNQMSMKQHFETVAGRVDHEIDWAATRMARNAGTNPKMPELIYNDMLALDTSLYAATTIFPDNDQFRQAKARVASELAKYGSRDGAGNALESAAMAKAASVRMPAATKRDASLESMFRTAMRTGGIDWEILKINPVGGWSTKRDSAGRVVGQTHDAWIAARNPANPDHCNLYDFTLLKDTSGSVRRNAHSTKRIACENVPK